MDKKNFKTFNKFWDEIKPKEQIIDTRSEDEIMKDILAIENRFKKREEE